MSGRKVHGKKEGREGGREGGREREGGRPDKGGCMTVHLSWMGWPSYFMSLVTVSSDVMQEPAVDQIGRVITRELCMYVQPHTEMNRPMRNTSQNNSLYVHKC